MKILVLVLTILFSASSIACKCGELEIGERLSNAQKVYWGKLTNANVLGDGSRISATIQVVESFKGEAFIHEEVITNNTSCAVRFTINDSYLVFEDNSGQVNQCTMFNTSLFYSKSGQENLNKLRQLVKE